MPAYIPSAPIIEPPAPPVVELSQVLDQKIITILSQTESPH
jgi:hypothetical protein